MDVSKLEVGMVVKNYKELCKLLEIEEKKGNPRMYQVKNFERFFAYEKQGYKFVIKEIYKVEKPKSDGRSTGKNNIYGELAQILLIDKLSRVKGGVLSISKSKLIKELSFTGENYTGAKYNPRGLAKYLDMDVKYVYDFYNINDSSFTGIINRALKNLQNKRIITYSTVYKIKLNEDSNNRIATDYEIKIITKCEKEALNELGFRSVIDIRKSPKWKIFKSLSLSKVAEKLDVQYYYQAYHIVINDEYLEEERLELINEIKNEQIRKEKHNEMNRLVIREFKKKIDEKSKTANDVKVKINGISFSDKVLDKESSAILNELKKVDIDDITKEIVLSSEDMPF